MIYQFIINEGLLLLLLLFNVLEWIKLLLLYKDENILIKDAEDGIKENLSVIIPVRNEESNIEGCLISIENNSYPIQDIIIVDDSSTDKTVKTINELRKKNPKIKLISIKELPEGWTGKNYALYTGSLSSNSEWLLFIDADVRLHKDTISKTIAYAKDNAINLLSFSPYQTCKKAYEKIIQPEIFNLINYLYPLKKINKDNRSSAINGSFILIRRRDYFLIGGHEAVKNEILEDVALAKKALQRNLRVKMLQGNSLIQSKMYNSFLELFQGWSKNLYLLIKESNKNFLIILIREILIYLLPLIFYIKLRIIELSMISYLFPLFINYSIRKRKKQYETYSFFYPLAGIIIILIMLNSYISIAIFKKSTWKGRKYNLRDKG